MQKTVNYCDRCGAEFSYPIIKKYHVGTPREPSLDLCQDCADSLAKWFKASKTAKQSELLKSLT